MRTTTINRDIRRRVPKNETKGVKLYGVGTYGNRGIPLTWASFLAMTKKKKPFLNSPLSFLLTAMLCCPPFASVHDDEEEEESSTKSSVRAGREGEAQAQEENCNISREKKRKAGDPFPS